MVARLLLHIIHPRPVQPNEDVTEGKPFYQMIMLPEFR